MPPRVTPESSYFVGSASTVTSRVMALVATLRNEFATWMATGKPALDAAGGVDAFCVRSAGVGADDVVSAEAASAWRVVTASAATARAAKSATRNAARFARDPECVPEHLLG
jgi:hypothetical protein